MELLSSGSLWTEIKNLDRAHKAELPYSQNNPTGGWVFDWYAGYSLIYSACLILLLILWYASNEKKASCYKEAVKKCLLLGQIILRARFYIFQMAFILFPLEIKT